MVRFYTKVRIRILKRTSDGFINAVRPTVPIRDNCQDSWQVFLLPLPDVLLPARVFLVLAEGLL
jgi:hypothetical protein